MWVFVTRLILRNRIAILSILAAVIAINLYYANNIRLSYGFARMMPEDDSVAVVYSQFEETFGQAGNAVVIVAQDPEFFTPEHLQNWSDYTDSLKAIEGISSAFSISNAFALRANEDIQQLELEPLLSELPTTQAEADSFRTRLLNLPFYDEFLFFKEESIIAMLVRVEDESLYTKDILRIVESIKKANEDFEERTGVDVHTSGLPYLRMANTLQLKREIYWLVALTILVTSILLYIFLRSFRATLISLSVVIIGVIFVFGLLGMLQFEISILSTLIPPLVIVIGVPNCIYLINKYHQEFKTHKNKMLALQRVISKVGTVTILTNFTTALGFATFILTDSQALVEFGIVTSTIILLVFVLSLTIIPIVYSFLTPPKERHYNHFDLAWLQAILRFLVSAVTNHRPAVYIASLAVVVAAVVGIFQLRVTGNLTDDFSESDPVYQDIKFIEKTFEGVMPLEIVVDTKRKNGVQKLRTLKKIDEFQEKVSALPTVSKSLSLVDFVKFARQGILFGNPDMYALPNRQEQQWMMQYLPHGEDANTALLYTLIDSTGQRARISMQMADLGTTEMRELQATIKSYAAEIFEADKYEITVTGSSVVFIRTTDYLIKNLILSMALAILVISILMAFLFGSGRMVFISIIPNMIPLIITAGLMGYFNIPLKPSTILVFSIAFGISIDDTLHFLARYRQELKINGWQIAPAATKAIQETGVSMFYTSVVLFFGFGVFLTSSFDGTMAVGLLVSITLFFAMLTNLLILPSFIMTLDKFIQARDFDESLLEIYEDAEDIEDEATADNGAMKGKK